MDRERGKDRWVDEWVSSKVDVGMGREWGTDRGRADVNELWEGLQDMTEWSPGNYPPGAH